MNSAPTASVEETLRAEVESLRIRLDEAEQTLAAIHEGHVDALVIAGPNGDNIFSLSGSDRNYRLLVESMGEGALTATADGSILYCNAKFALMVGERQETVVGRSMSEFIAADQKEGFEKFLRAKGDIAGKREVILTTKEGSEISVQVSVGRLDAEGLDGISIILTDLTETKLAAALAKANFELSRSNAELTRFAFVASHDLKEPLRVVSNYAQMLELRYREKLDSDATTYIKFITGSVTRMYALINDLLSYSHIGADDAGFVSVDCNHVVQETILNLEQLIKETGTEIKYSPLPTIIGDSGQFVQLFQNLISNAIKYRGQQPPKISIGSRREGRNWVFSVTDNGIGIEPEFFKKIFVIFQRLHAKDEYSGTGIGLAICKKVVERHGGEIWVESKLHYGSTFFFSVPDPEKKDDLRS